MAKKPKLVIMIGVAKPPKDAAKPKPPKRKGK